MKVTGQLSLNDSGKPCNKKAETEPKPQFWKSFHRIKDDPVTSKSLSWVTTGKEKKGTLSSIVAVNNTNGIQFGKVLHFKNKLIESACVLVFSVTTQDKESSLWWVKISRFTEKIVPVEEISKPLVTANDDEDYNKLWILNHTAKA